MESLSKAQREPRCSGVLRDKTQIAKRFRHVIGRGGYTCRTGAGALSRGFAPVRRLSERLMCAGTRGALPVDTHKRVRLCNLLALGGALIMGSWALFELGFGDQANVGWEVGFTAAFVGVLGLNALCVHRTARVLLIITGNMCVLAGCLLFPETSGGSLPFFAIAGVSLLLFGPREWPLVALGAGLPVLLLIGCKSGLASALFAVEPRPAPGWYFAANAATTFGLGFLIPFFFFRSNLRAEASLQRLGQEKLKRLIDADLIGVVRGRLSGRIEDANDTFLDLLGYTRHDLAAGALDLRLIAPLEPFQSELHRGASVYERVCRRRDGRKVPVLVGVAFLDESDDEVVGFVLDLTAQKHVEAQRTLLHDSREALRLRDLFNSIASHELKTPLTALMLNLELLSKRLDKDVSGGDKMLRARLIRCESAATRMGELIDALLDVARIHRGRFTLDVHDTDLVAAVRKAVSGFQASKTGGGVPRIAVRADGPVTARLDALRFDQVVTNLLSNAVKYGAGKPIEVRVGHDSAADVAHLEVVDHGPGIEPAMAEKIFEPFQRAKATEPIPGLGLGLYVVKLIVESHGGHIAVDSQPGQGSRFIVDLPRGGDATAGGPISQ
jgi:PAS domain S-box-containing protein